MRQVRFRALITLDRAAPGRSAHQYPNHTHALIVRARRPGPAPSTRYFPAEISRDDERPLHPGDHAVVTITVADDEAAAFFDAGQHFALWNGDDIGHGIVSRRVYTPYGPS